MTFILYSTYFSELYFPCIFLAGYGIYWENSCLICHHQLSNPIYNDCSSNKNVKIQIEFNLSVFLEIVSLGVAPVWLNFNICNQNSIKILLPHQCVRNESIEKDVWTYNENDHTLHLTVHIWAAGSLKMWLVSLW